jgi:membrane protease YdiL (CAAX protease family)
MEQIMMGAIVFAIVLVIKRREVFTLRWQPERGTWVAVGTGLLAFLLSAFLLLLEPGSLAAQLVLYGGIWVVCGVLVPWGYVLLVERDSAAGLGLRKDRWVQSLLIGIGLAAFLSPVIIFQADLSVLDWGEVGRAAVVLIGAGGLFELFLYYGFIHIRLEKAFGPIPAILLTALVYVLWHVGTQLPLEADYWLGALKLFGVGVMGQAIFSLTYNLAIIWPFFMGIGVMIDFIVNIGDLEPISAAFPWGVGSILAMALAIVAIWLAAKGKAARSSLRS